MGARSTACRARNTMAPGGGAHAHLVILVLVIPMVAVQGCITIMGNRRVAPHRLEAPPARIEVMKVEGQPWHEVRTQYDDGTCARWGLRPGADPKQLLPDAPLSRGRPLIVTSSDFPDQGPRAHVRLDDFGTKLVVITEHGQWLAPLWVDAERRPSWWRVLLWAGCPWTW